MTDKQVPMGLLHNSTLGVLKKERNPKNKPHCYTEPSPNLNKKKSSMYMQVHAWENPRTSHKADVCMCVQLL